MKVNKDLSILFWLKRQSYQRKFGANLCVYNSKGRPYGVFYSGKKCIRIIGTKNPETLSTCFGQGEIILTDYHIKRWILYLLQSELNALNNEKIEKYLNEYPLR